MALPPIFKTYLRGIDMTAPLIERTAEVYDFYRPIVNAAIPAIFVSEYVTDEGLRQYDSLWLFTPRLVMEAKSFLKTDDFDFAPIRLKMTYIRFLKEEYDFRRATEKSRLSVQCRDEGSVTYSLRASGANCDRLKDVSLRFLMRNLKL
ncbi:MAG: hypothetical protein IH959_06185 [Chloroflexi bacterium]|nr:hypothetical protein [Chloroflexota bacterium]